MKVRTGENVWVRLADSGVSEELEIVQKVVQPEDPGSEFVPHYNPRRVTGSSYEYYEGSSDWVREANRAMASKANYNFRNKGH